MARSRAGRASTPERARALRWLVGLRTRNGTSRAVRVALCGRPVAVVRDGDWQPSWQHATCKDRGCPACAQARSRRLAVQIREAVEHRRAKGAAALAFVTLTQPRRAGERLADALARFELGWQRLRRMPEFHVVAGGLRVLEVTHSPQGWHVHAHTIVEVFELARIGPCPTCNGAARMPRLIAGQWCTRACRTCSSSTQPGDGTMRADLAVLVRTWAALVDGSTAAQCAVPLDDRNAGQLAKYLSKLWELDDASCRELFVAFAGKRLVQPWGSWYRSETFAPKRATGRQWFRGMFVADVERMHPRSYIDFHASVAVRFELRSQPWVDATRACSSLAVEPARIPRKGKSAKRVRELAEPTAPSWRPVLEVHRMTAGAFLRALRGDDRRADEHPPPPSSTPTPGADACRLARGCDGPWAHRRRTGRWLLGDIEPQRHRPTPPQPRRLPPSSSPWPRPFELWCTFDAPTEMLHAPC